MEQYIIPGAAAIIVAIIEGIAARERSRAKKQQERREEAQNVQMSMMAATMELSIVSANAVTGGHNNGNVERAKEAAEKANSDYNCFLRRQTAHQVSKV